jgi:hypothetical protein
MNNTRIAIRKILNKMLSEKYPDISGIQVTDEDWGYTHQYKVFLGVKYNVLSKLNADEVRDYVIQISKYILGSNESIYQVVFYDPEGYH